MKRQGRILLYRSGQEQEKPSGISTAFTAATEKTEDEITADTWNNNRSDKMCEGISL